MYSAEEGCKAQGHNKHTHTLCDRLNMCVSTVKNLLATAAQEVYYKENLILLHCRISFERKKIESTVTFFPRALLE